MLKNYDDAGFPPPPKIEKLKDDFTIGVFLAVASTNIYTKLREATDVYGILFDDIIKKPEVATKAIFKLCGLPMDLVQNAIEAFKIDSQRNTPISREALSKVPQLEISEEDRVRASALLVRCGYPPLDQPCLLEGTVDFNEIVKSK